MVHVLLLTKNTKYMQVWRLFLSQHYLRFVIVIIVIVIVAEIAVRDRDRGRDQKNQSRSTLGTAHVAGGCIIM